MTESTTTRRWAALTACSFAIAATACGGGGTDGRACGPTVREALDPAYLVHVVGAAAEVSYTSDPPTSGPHQPAPAIVGVSSEPLPASVQVGILERGDVLIQHAPDLPADDLGALTALAGARVVVAPNPDLPATVVATAWTAKRSCDAVDVPTLRDFIRERAGKGPES